MAERNNLFNGNVTIEILIYLKSRGNVSCSSKMSKDLKLANNTVYNNLKKLENMGLVEGIKEGRKKGIKLTELGKEIGRDILSITNKINYPRTPEVTVNE